MCGGGGGGGGGEEDKEGDRRSDRIKVSIPYTQSYIKFQVPSSSGSLVLKQIKGVTDRKGTNSANLLRNSVKS